jgi:hypothetical protein
MGNGKDRLKDREFIGPLFQNKFQFLFVVVRGSKYGKLQCPQSHLRDFCVKLTANIVGCLNCQRVAAFLLFFWFKRALYHCM